MCFEQQFWTDLPLASSQDPEMLPQAGKDEAAPASSTLIMEGIGLVCVFWVLLAVWYVSQASELINIHIKTKALSWKFYT